MKTIKIILMLAVVLMVVLYVVGYAPPKNPATDKLRYAFVSLPMKYQTLLTTWLSQDCFVDSGKIETDMASAGLILEGALWEAYNLGPTEEVRNDLQHSLGERYALRLRWLKQNGLEAIKSSVLTQLLEESEEHFRATEMGKLNDRWRDAALAGLRFVCTDRSLEKMRLIAKDTRNPSSIAASEALKASGNCTLPTLRNDSVRRK